MFHLVLLIHTIYTNVSSHFTDIHTLYSNVLSRFTDIHTLYTNFSHCLLTYIHYTLQSYLVNKNILHYNLISFTEACIMHYSKDVENILNTLRLHVKLKGD